MSIFEQGLDANGQPMERCFNYRRNLDKGQAVLGGFLKGILSDGVLDKWELTFLAARLSESTITPDAQHYDLILNLELALSDHLKNGTESTSGELIRKIKTYLACIDDSHNAFEESVNELLGILDGVVADGVFHVDEAEYLRRWLKAHPAVASAWPGSEIFKALENMGGSITNAEVQHKLIGLAQDITGNKPEETGSVVGASTAFFDDGLTEVAVPSERICLTGKFLCGPRNILEDDIESRGGKITKGVTKSLRYLIVGGEGSRDWRFESYGRKIEKAVQYIEQGVGINIMSEKRFVELMR